MKLLQCAAIHLSSREHLAILSDAGSIPELVGIRVEFILFAATLLGVALFHHHTLKVALCGLAAILVFRFVFTDFDLWAHLFTGLLRPLATTMRVSGN
ncbi:MAG TPA: hypothetical protein VK843_22150 [Planctomycetota bacterium]|nr:hypothetical protein [Planctomycetota bacterium]